MTAPKTQELYAKVTASIINALESGAANPNGWRAPWHVPVGFGLPANIVSKKEYRGVNTVILWAQQIDNNYSSSVWGTYNQWAVPLKDDDGNVVLDENLRPVLKRHVRKGETGTKIFLWKPTKRTVKDEETGEKKQTPSLYATTYTVFNADQVEGYEQPKKSEVVEPFQVVEHAQEWFAALGAKVEHGGSRAYYSAAADFIQLPKPEWFDDNVSYYSTSAHEHVHWTGHEKRCNRELRNSFGSPEYAAEELVAEIGSAFVCARLGLENTPRADHSHYVANWLQILKKDPSALVSAASKAQKATDWLIEHAEPETVLDQEEEQVQQEGHEVAVTA